MGKETNATCGLQQAFHHREWRHTGVSGPSAKGTPVWDHGLGSQRARVRACPGMLFQGTSFCKSA